MANVLPPLNRPFEARKSSHLRVRDDYGYPHPEAPTKWASKGSRIGVRSIGIGQL